MVLIPIWPYGQVINQTLTVFICTTALFLCGYAVQQKTVNDIREAIKPQPRPVHTNLYVPPNPDATPIVNLSGEDDVQIIELAGEGRHTEDQGEEPAEEAAWKQAAEEDNEQGLVQGADGGFLRKQSQRQRKQKALLEEIIAEESSSDGMSNLGMSAEASGGSTADPRQRLSRAVRRKLIKDEFVKLAGEDMLNDPKTYKRRRLW